jgi:hypothetical protein
MDLCGGAIDACLPPVTGPETCEAVQDCYSACAAGDQACVQSCYDSGTATAQAQLDALSACLSAQCAGLTGDAWVTCAYDKCAGPIDACFPPANCPLTGGACGAGQACYPTASDATDCFPSQGLAAGAACADTAALLACGDGLLCVTFGAGVGECLPMCLAPQHCGPGLQCDKPIFSGLATVGICTCVDADHDGFCQDVDCDDAVGATNPASADACGDGVDNDCDGQTDETCGGDDAGSAGQDAGSAGQDAGSAGQDAGSAGQDAGGASQDAGSAGQDAGGASQDAGSAAAEVGPADPDAASTGPEAGSAGQDAGASGAADSGTAADAAPVGAEVGGIAADLGASAPGVGGGGTSGDASSGCGAAPRSGAGPLPLAGLALLGVLLRGRRRRAGGPLSGR